MILINYQWCIKLLLSFVILFLYKFGYIYTLSLINRYYFSFTREKHKGVYDMLTSAPSVNQLKIRETSHHIWYENVGLIYAWDFKFKF